MSRSKDRRISKKLKVLNRAAAGIDIGSKSNFVAVDPSSDPHPVREFSTFTDGLQQLVAWLLECRVTTVAMEATGIYWLPLFEMLEAKGFEVFLVNARHVKNVPGRKSDVLDCQWLQQLHSYGLLQNSFRPEQEICTLRAYVRQRATLIRYAASHINHMQKALRQMNLLLDQVVSDITGKTGMRIIKAILAGEREALNLSALRDGRCKRSQEEIGRALKGHYRDEYILQLRQALELYEQYQVKISECEKAIAAHLEKLAAEKNDGQSGQSNDEPIQLSTEAAMRQLIGLDLTSIEGISEKIALIIISEIGLDMSRWPTVKHFASWLGLCPGTKVSGGKILSSQSRHVVNKAALALRMSAFGLHSSKSALGAYFRRMKSRLGTAKAITATAHKLARLVYSLLKNGAEYVAVGQQAYEDQYQTRKLKNLNQLAQAMGFKLIPTN